MNRLEPHEKQRVVESKVGSAVLERILASGLDYNSVFMFLSGSHDTKSDQKLSTDDIDNESVPLLPWESLAESTEAGDEALRKGRVALAILNGGMATRFGGVPKGIVGIGQSLSFIAVKLLDALEQTSRIGAPLCPIFLMCSDATHKATKLHLERHNWFGYAPQQVHLFNQCESIRLLTDGNVFLDANGEPSYHGTGHGDLPYCIRKVGAFKDFANNGKAVLMSNVDNVLATLDRRVLSTFLNDQRAMMVEVVDKNPGDVGGAPLCVNGRPQVVEAFRLDANFRHDKVPVFNTNTLWFRPQTLMRDDLHLPWHRVEKQVNQQTVIQFERLIGEVSAEVETCFLRVPRDGLGSRFIPVKTPEDLQNHGQDILKRWLERQRQS